MNFRNLDRLRHILEAAERIGRFIKGQTYEDFRQNEMMFSAVVRELEVIGEAMNKLDDDFRGMYLDVPHADIVSMRNRLTHEYFDISAMTLWKTCTDDLPKLKEQVKTLIVTLESEKP